MPPLDPADPALLLVHEGWNHLRLQRPVAAWASWQRAIRIDPDQRAALEAIAMLAQADELPLAARTTYRFRSAEGDERRARWSATFADRDLQDLDIASQAFDAIAEADPTDASAIFNLALCLAWQGRNREAIAALEFAVAADATDQFDLAVSSWMLAEILRQGGGAEDLADDMSFTVSYDWPASRGDALDALRSVATVQILPTPPDPATGAPQEANLRVAEWHESADEVARVAATVLVFPDQIRLSSPDRTSLERAARLWQDSLPEPCPDLEWRSTPLPIRLMDTAVWLFRLPDDASASDQRAEIERYFETRWIHIPRHGLGDEDLPRSPARAAREAAAGNAILRAKLTAVVQVREQLAARNSRLALYDGYPFDRLRRRLGLTLNQPESVETTDLSCMSFAELEALDPATLSDADLADAIHAATDFANLATTSAMQAERARRAGDAESRPSS